MYGVFCTMYIHLHPSGVACLSGLTLYTPYGVLRVALMYVVPILHAAIGLFLRIFVTDGGGECQMAAHGSRSPPQYGIQTGKG